MNHVCAAVPILALLWWGVFDTALALECEGKVVSSGWSVRESSPRI
jgi:hypothetical protein